jgi:uncharacterized protein YbaP (TraB family)
MRFSSSLGRFCGVVLILLASLTVQAQTKSKTYNSLLWEITGNGLQKPSYLFGTMHISNKMVFHLSDSFYMAIRNSDVVAIELNPEQWQNEIPRMSKQTELYKYYNATYYTDYFKENSFTGSDFVNLLQGTLRFEPELNDALLYRNESRMDNFQEDTYLDLYIYQTGKKLGKKTAGVETFMGSQRMMMEALVDAANEKEKKQKNSNSREYYELGQTLQDAYRRGDLDMLDSINKITEYAESFTEKFLYKRNEMQAASMDSIMQARQSLFVGVGAAHLPGKRGVIEILRKKGYTLRPIYMQDRDATQKKYIDSLTAPVHFVKQYSADSFFSVATPGRLNDLGNSNISLKHYADMGNGSYYMVTRIRTNTLFNGYDQNRILKITDSLLYENIPGTILSKNAINKNGYDGFDIVNRTKKGDIQHYQLFIAPTEVIIFKMGGKGNYVKGTESEAFFNSIAFKEKQTKADWKPFTPATGGFTVNMPVVPQSSFVSSANDGLPEWRYESVDPLNGDHYAVFRKSMYSFDFIEADTFDQFLMLESFGSNDQWKDTKKVDDAMVNGKLMKGISVTTKDGEYIQARAVLFGPQYYLLVHRSAVKPLGTNPFFNSFSFAPFSYAPAKDFTDTSLNFSVTTSVKPSFDADVMDMMMYAKKNEQILKKETTYSASPDNTTANFVSEETGEVIVVNIYKYPQYYYSKDSVKFMQPLFNPDSSLVLRRKTQLNKGEGTKAWLMEWSDTASTRLIRKLVLQKGLNLLTANTNIDSVLPESTFIKDFYSTLNFYNVKAEPDVFTNKQAVFFKDYYSTDTVVSKKAKSALPSLYYGKEGYPQILKAIKKLNPKDKDYYEIKTKFIDELGFINDSTVSNDVIQNLKQIYIDAGDTTIFQNSALKALSRLHTAKATEIFKELVLQDPPAFEESYEYTGLFSAYEDSLKLATGLYPEILNLTTIEDFKTPVRSLLAMLLDSNYLKPELYEDYVGNIYFDAKIALKKLQNAKEISSQSTNNNEEESVTTYSTEAPPPPKMYGNYSANSNNDIITYINLLAPYYDKNPNLPAFFNKLLLLNNDRIKMNTALALLKYKQPVADSMWRKLAENKALRNVLIAALEKQQKTELVPAKYRSPEATAAGVLYNTMGNRIDTLVQLNKRPFVYQGKDRTVYFFKYKTEGNDTWKLAISSVLKDKDKGIKGDYELFWVPDTNLAANNKELQKQQEEEFKKLLISRRNSGSQFYGNTNNGEITGVSGE